MNIILPENSPAGSKYVGDFSNKEYVYLGASVGVYYFV
jgi:hypothetical protein